MKFALSLLTFLLSSSVFGQNLNRARTIQEVNATTFIDQLQRSDTPALGNYFSSSYYSRNKKKLATFIKLFEEDFNKLPGDTKRYSSLEFPKGLNLVKFRYIDDTGTILQVEISYTDGDVNSKIVRMSLITTTSLLKGKNTNRVAGYDIDML